MKSLFYPKSCRARVEGIISLWTAPTPVGSFWALLSMGRAKAGKLAELQDALVLGPLGFIAETLLPDGLWNSTWDSCLITASIMHQFLHFLLSSSHWSPAMTIHANTALHYLLSEISRRAWFSTPPINIVGLWTRADASNQWLGCPWEFCYILLKILSMVLKTERVYFWELRERNAGSSQDLGFLRALSAGWSVRQFYKSSEKPLLMPFCQASYL